MLRTALRTTVRPAAANARAFSVSALRAAGSVTYNDVKPITRQPSDDVTIIDVRDPKEVENGSIPSAMNVPLSRLAEVLKETYPDGAFQKEFAFPRPSKNQKMIFYDRDGKNLAKAAELAEQAGYKNIKNYEGAWQDWQEKEAKNKK